MVTFEWVWGWFLRVIFDGNVREWYLSEYMGDIWVSMNGDNWESVSVIFELESVVVLS